MRHRKAGVKLNRTSSHRKAMFRNMVTSLLKHEKIQTTDTKAKALRSWVDHIITLAKRGDLHARRQALSIVREKNVVHKLFTEAAEKFGGRQGGYTRITKLGRRSGDAAPVSIMELITSEEGSKKKVTKKKETPVAEPKIDSNEKMTDTAPALTEKTIGAEDKKISEKTDIPAKEKTAEDSGIEVASPVQEEVPAEALTDNQTAGKETEKLQEVEDKIPADDKNQEDKK